MATFTATVQTGKVSGTNANFPAYVNLALLPIEFWNVVANGGGDIRVYTDSGLTTEIPREVVSCDTATDTGELWCKVGSMTSSTQVWITVDGTSADYAVTATYGRNAVWSDYKAVYHLQEAVNTTTDGYVDSTGNGYDGTGVSMSLTAPNGKIGKAQDFDGTADYINTKLPLSELDGDFSLQMWMKSEGISTKVLGPIGERDTGSSSNNYRCNWYFRKSDNLWGVGIWDGSSLINQQGFGYTSFNWTTNLEYLVSVLDGTTLRKYHQGSLIDTHTSVTQDFSALTGYRLQIGARNTNSSGGPNGPHDGPIDEVRAKAGTLSADQISTEYQNQNDNSAFWGTWSEVGGGAFTLAVDTMALVATFNAVTLRTARKLVAETMALASTFNDVILSRTFAGITLVVDTMAITATFADTFFRRTYKLVADTMAIAVTYADTALKKGFKIAVDTMALSVTFADTILRRGYKLAIDTMELATTFNAVTFTYVRKLVVGTMAVVTTFADVLLKIPGRWTKRTTTTATYTKRTKPTTIWTKK